MSLWRRLIRFGFRLLYHELAVTYDTVSWWVSGGEWTEWCRAALSVTQPQTHESVLEIAHGTGTLQVDLAQAGITAWGVDYSPQMGHITAAKLRRHGFETRLIRAKGQALPFPHASFDVIVCTFPSDFIIASETLCEFLRVLKPDGRGAIVLHGGLTRGNLWLRLMDGLFRITGQGRILDQAVPSPNDLEERYQLILSKIRAAGIRVQPKAIPTQQGYAVVLEITHPKIGVYETESAKF